MCILLTGSWPWGEAVTATRGTQHYNGHWPTSFPRPISFLLCVHTRANVCVRDRWGEREVRLRARTRALCLKATADMRDILSALLPVKVKLKSVALKTWIQKGPEIIRRGFKCDLRSEEKSENQKNGFIHFIMHMLTLHLKNMFECMFYNKRKWHVCSETRLCFESRVLVEEDQCQV